MQKFYEMRNKILAYARKDKRTSCGILMCTSCSGRSVPRYVISVDKYNKISNKDDFIVITKELLDLRPSLKSDITTSEDKR